MSNICISLYEKKLELVRVDLTRVGVYGIVNAANSSLTKNYEFKKSSIVVFLQLQSRVKNSAAKTLCCKYNPRQRHDMGAEASEPLYKVCSLVAEGIDNIYH